jgi:hypothetical protein
MPSYRHGFFLRIVESHLSSARQHSRPALSAVHSSGFLALDSVPPMVPMTGSLVFAYPRPAVRVPNELSNTRRLSVVSDS